MPDLPRLSLPLPPPNTAEVWELPIAKAMPYLEPWHRWLSGEESQRAERFYRQEDRDRFILSRGGLRYLLSQYLGCAPETLAFTYGTHGKPALTQATPLQFNLAHSADWVIYGISQGRAIGVDVEQVRDRGNLDGLIERCLTPQEQRHLPAADRDRLYGFLHHWTIKEAHLKAIGHGLSTAMTAVEISGQSPPHLVRPARWSGQRFPGWTLHRWDPTPTTLAALCLEGTGGAIALRPFPL
jgi:4'-phosphopantetheinyl transferase